MFEPGHPRIPMCVHHDGSAGMPVEMTQENRLPAPVNEQFAQLPPYYYGIPVLPTQPQIALPTGEL